MGSIPFVSGETHVACLRSGKVCGARDSQGEGERLKGGAQEIILEKEA